MRGTRYGRRTGARGATARRGIISLGVLFCGVLLATGCHKKTPVPESYYGQTALSGERAVVMEEVPDSARRDAIMAVLDQAESRLRQFSTDAQPVRARLDAMMFDRDATEEELRVLYAEFDSTRHDMARDMVAFQVQIKKMTFPNEWEKIADRQNLPAE